MDQWRRTSGLHKVRGRRALGAVRALWTTRDQIAAERDVTPSRIIPDSAIVAAALAMPTTRTALKATKGFYGRGADRYAGRWVAVLAQVRDLPEAQLPTRTPRADGPPPPRAWADKDPVAARRLQLAREAIIATAEELRLPAENLLTPDFLRRVLWTPPETREPRAAHPGDLGGAARPRGPGLAGTAHRADARGRRAGGRRRGTGLTARLRTSGVRRVRRRRLRSRRHRLGAEDRLRGQRRSASPISGRSMVGTA